MLADFGSACVMTTPVEMSSEEQGTAAFMAPELLSPAKFGLEKGVPSKEADIYSVGMTAYHVLTGKVPFISSTLAGVVIAVTNGQRPHKPMDLGKVGMTERVWDLMEKCWNPNRMARPTIIQVLEKFYEFTGGNKVTNSTVQRFATSRLHPGGHSSVLFQSSSLAAASRE